MDAKDLRTIPALIALGLLLTFTVPFEYARVPFTLFSVCYRDISEAVERLPEPNELYYKRMWRGE